MESIKDKEFDNAEILLKQTKIMSSTYIESMNKVCKTLKFMTITYVTSITIIVGFICFILKK